MNNYVDEYAAIITTSGEDTFTPISQEYTTMIDSDSIVYINGRDVVLDDIGTIVKGDSNSQMITFVANRYYDGIDLSKMSISVFYKNGKEVYVDNAVNISASNSQIKFNWLVSGNATKSLSITTMIQFSGTNEKNDNYILRTKLFTIKIEDSILTSELSPNDFEDWFSDVNNRIKTLEDNKTEIPEKEVIEAVNKRLEELDLITTSKILKSISATKDKTVYNMDDAINIDDITVTATYTDGTTEKVSKWYTNVDEIDTFAEGLRKLEVYYTLLGITKSTTIYLTVKMNSADNIQYLYCTNKNGLLQNGTSVLKLTAKLLKRSIINIRYKIKLTVNKNRNSGYTTIGLGSYNVWGTNTLGSKILNPNEVGEWILEYNVEQEFTHANITPDDVTMFALYMNGGERVEGTFELLDYSLSVTKSAPFMLETITASKDIIRYINGETIGTDDIKVTAIYSDDTTAPVSDFITNVKDALTEDAEGNIPLTITYTENKVTRETQIILKIYKRELTEPQEFHDMTAKEYCEAWGFGVNYGNVLDARPNGYSASTTRATIDSYIKDHQQPEGGDTFMNQETAWGQPIALPEHFKAFKEAGFDMVRIPVSWCYNSYIERNEDGSPVTDEDGYTIRHMGKYYACRVREIVDWALDAGLYVVINMHHEQPIIYAASTASQMEQAYRDAKNMWTEIANKFKYYNEKLSFEGFNEIDNLKSSFNYSDESAEQMNKFNQIFVDVVRASGGNNTKRVLHCPTIVHISTENALRAWVKPTDTIDNHIILNVHDYSLAYLQQLDPEFSIMEKYSDLYNVPVCIGEWGTTTGECDGSKTNLGNRDIHAQNFTALARLHKLYPIWWCNNSNYRLFLKSNTSTVETEKYINNELCSELQNRIKKGWSTLKGYRIPDNQIAIYNQLDQFELLNWSPEKGYYNSYWGTATLKTPISTSGMLNKTLIVTVSCSGLATDLWVQLASVKFLREYVNSETGKTEYELLNSEGGSYHNRSISITFEDTKCTHMLISLNAAQTNIKEDQFKSMFNNGEIKLQYMCYTQSDISEYQYAYRTLSSISGTKKKYVYVIGDTLNTDDIVITATYSDGYTKSVNATYDISSVKMSEKGVYNIIASYSEDAITKTCEIEIMVGQVLQSITVTKMITKSKIGMPIDISDIEVTAIYTDGSTEIVNGWTTNVDSIDNTIVGDVDLIITYVDPILKIMRTATIKYTLYDRLLLQDSNSYADKSQIIFTDTMKESYGDVPNIIWISNIQKYMYAHCIFSSDIDIIYADCISGTEINILIPGESTYSLSANWKKPENTFIINSNNTSKSTSSTNATISAEYITSASGKGWTKFTITAKDDNTVSINYNDVPIYMATENDIDTL